MIEKPISDLWRVKSGEPGVDLKSILDGAKRFGECLEQPVEVTWAGLPKTYAIPLDATAIIGLEHPLPGDRVDVVLGEMPHQLGHKLWSMSPSKKAEWAKKKTGMESGRPTEVLLECDAIIEDSYIDARIPDFMPFVFGEYLWRARNFYGELFGGILNQGGEFTAEFMILYWATFWLYHNTDLPPLPDFYEGLLPPADMQNLIKLSMQAQHAHQDPDQRLKLSLQAFKILSKYPLGKKLGNLKASFGGPNTAVSLFHPTEMGDNPLTLGQKDKKAVKNAIANDTEDITDAVAAFANTSGTVVVEKAKYNATLATIHKKNVQGEIHKIRKLFQEFRYKRERYRRGMEYGKLSGRRVWKTSYGDKHVFDSKDAPGVNLALAVVLDMSMTMKPYSKLILDSAVAFKEALQKESIYLVIVGYKGTSPKSIMRIWDKGTGEVLLDTGDWDGTPTAEALATARTLLMKASSPQKVIINVTDGDPDDEDAQKEVCKKLRAEGFKVLCVLPMGLKAEGYDTLVYVENITQLPQALHQALRAVLK